MSQPAIPVIIVDDESSGGGGSLSTTQYLKAYDVITVTHTITITPTVDVTALATSGVFNVSTDFPEFKNTLILDPTITPGSEAVSYAVYDFGNGYVRRSNTPGDAITYDYSLTPDGFYSINIYFYGASGNYTRYNLLLEKANGYISKLTHNSSTSLTYIKLLNTVYLPVDAGVIGTPINENGTNYTTVGTLDFNYIPQIDPFYSESKGYTPTTECNTLADGIQYPLLTSLSECTLETLDSLINETLVTRHREVLAGIDSWVSPANVKTVSVYPVTVGDAGNRPTITDADALVSNLYASVEEKFETTGVFTDTFTVTTNHANDVVIVRYTVLYVAP